MSRIPTDLPARDSDSASCVVTEGFANAAFAGKDLSMALASDNFEDGKMICESLCKKETYQDNVLHVLKGHGLMDELRLPGDVDVSFRLEMRKTEAYRYLKSDSKATSAVCT